MYLKLNDYIEVSKKSNRIIFKNNKLSKEYHIKYNDLIYNIILNIQVPIKYSKITQLLSEKYSENINEISNVIEQLKEIDVITQSTVENGFENQSDTIYSRQIEYFESLFDVENGQKIQDKISDMHIVIVGTGGIGTWTSLFLTQIGVKKITLIDDDIVNISNIPRQVLFNFKDIGKKKVLVLKERLSLINNDVEIDTLSFKITEDDIILDKINNFDLVINCADSPNVSTTSKWINNYCYPRNIPFTVGGGYSIHSSKIGTTIIPRKTPCWECYIKDTENTFYDVEREILVPAYRDFKGALNIACVLTSAIQTLDIIRYISDNDPFFKSSTGEWDLRSLDFHYYYFKKQPNCAICNQK